MIDKEALAIFLETACAIVNQNNLLLDRMDAANFDPAVELDNTRNGASDDLKRSQKR